MNILLKFTLLFIIWILLSWCFVQEKEKKVVEENNWNSIKEEKGHINYDDDVKRDTDFIVAPEKDFTSVINEELWEE